MTAIKLLVTGASGFVGRALIAEALARRISVRAAVRRPELTASVERIVVGEIDDSTDWSSALAECSAVVHLANLAHAPPSIAELERVNVAGTLRLAEQAAERGVEHLVFLSSIKAVGEESPDRPLREYDPPRPMDPYGRAKLEAERGLGQISSRTGLRVTVMRPPLVYGPGVKGNFAALLRAVARGYPMPLASVENRRSFIYVGNLVDAILRCTAPSDLRWRVFHVSDGQSVSTPQLVRALAGELGRAARMFPFPPALLEQLAMIAGRGPMARSLTRSLVVDDSAIKAALGWQPPFSFEEGVRRTVQKDEGRR